MVQVLNLRKKSENKVTNKPTEQVAKKQEAVAPQISWEAPSFYFNPQKRYFALIVTALAISGGAMLFLNRDTLTAIFLLLASLVLILYSNKRPEISNITITQNGIEIGDKFYYYKDLKSFWINYNPGQLKELSLESRKWYVSYIKVLIEKENPIDIRSFLINFLPEKEHDNSLVDIVSRKMGL